MRMYGNEEKEIIRGLVKVICNGDLPEELKEAGLRLLKHYNIETIEDLINYFNSNEM